MPFGGKPESCQTPSASSFIAAAAYVIAPHAQACGSCHTFPLPRTTFGRTGRVCCVPPAGGASRLTLLSAGPGLTAGVRPGVMLLALALDEAWP